MNLVAKEYVAAQIAGRSGRAVLSRFAGAAHELDAALIVNPYDTEATATAIARALDMPLEERQERWTRHDGAARGQQRRALVRQLPRGAGRGRLPAAARPSPRPRRRGRTDGGLCSPGAGHATEFRSHDASRCSPAGRPPGLNLAGAGTCVLPPCILRVQGSQCIASMTARRRRSGRRSTARASTSPCSRRTPPRSISACSIRTGRREIERVRAAAPHRPGLARLSRRPRPGPALRLPRARSLRSAARPPLQPAQAADRPLRPPALRPHPLARRAVRLPHGRPARRPHPRPPRQRADDAEMRGRGSRRITGATTGRRAAAWPTRSSTRRMSRA